MTEEQRKPRQTLEQLAAQSSDLGLACPKCGWTCMPVVRTYRFPNNETERVRECRRCRHRVLCREKIVADVKKREVVDDPPQHDIDDDSEDVFPMKIVPPASKRTKQA